MNQTATKQYSQVQIRTANKGKLIVMLYQGAIRNMKKAIIQLENQDIEAKGKSLIKAQDIVLELLYALDPDMLKEGDELAQNLQRLYLYCYRQLVQANIQMEVKLIEEVIPLLDNLLEAWEQVATQPDQGTNLNPGQTQGVALTG